MIAPYNNNNNNNSNNTSNWKTCHYIYLHADADMVSGKIPQCLYESVGYELMMGSSSTTTTPPPAAISTKKKNKKKKNEVLTVTLEEEFAWAAGQGLGRLTAI